MGCSRRRLGCAASLRADVSASRVGEDCPRAHSIGPRLRDPFYSTAIVEREDAETRAVMRHSDCACYVCGNPVRPTKLFLPSAEESIVPLRSLRAESQLHQEGASHASNGPIDVQEKGFKSDSTSRKTRSLHSAVGNFLSLLGIPQYADQFMDLGLDNLTHLSRLSDEGLVKETEKICFLPGHRARLLRGVLALREVSLMRVREQASKTRERALFDCFVKRNQDLAQEVYELDSKLKTLQAQNGEYEEQLKHFRWQAAELEVTLKTQAEQVRSLTERLEQSARPSRCTKVNASTAVTAMALEAWTFESENQIKGLKGPLNSTVQSHSSQGSHGVKGSVGFDREIGHPAESESMQTWILSPHKADKTDKTDKTDKMTERLERSERQIATKLNLASMGSMGSTCSFGRHSEESPPSGELISEVQATDEIACSCASVISRKMRPDAGEWKDKDLWTPGYEPGDFPGRFEIAEFLIDTWNDILPERGQSLESSQSFLTVAVLLLCYLDHLSQSSQPLLVTVQNWQRLLFTLMRRAAKEHLRLQEETGDCLGLYSKEETRLFNEVVCSRSDLKVSREDAVEVLDLLGLTSQIQDLQLAFEN